MKGKEASKRPASILGIIFVTAILTLIVAGVAAYFAGYLKPPQHQTIPSPARDTVKDSALQEKERKILYWRAPMNPNEIYDKPGKSAMGMDLVPVYEDDASGGSGIRIDPVIQQNMGIRTALVRKGPLIDIIRTYGHITPDETRTTQISLKTSGWIERLYVDFRGKYVEKGDPLFGLYAPELVAAQEEYLVAHRNRNTGSGRRGGGLLEPARRRLRYFDVADSEIRHIEETGKVQKSLLIRSPFSGFVIEKSVNEGDFAREGTRIFQIANLARVWVEAHIYEYELPWVHQGQKAEMSLSYIPGKVFHGKVAYVYPYVQPKTRDVVIRLEFENPDYELKPDMYAEVRIKAETKEEGLIIPSEAVIRSGQRNIVFVTRGKGKFMPRDIVLGKSLENGQLQVLVGLSEGETIVTSGQFLLDSESTLREAVQKMLEPQEPEKKEDFFKELEE